MIATEFSGRKLRRKLVADGLFETVRAAGDLMTRKLLGRPFFDPLVDREVVRTLSRGGLRRRAERVEVPDLDPPKPFSAILNDGIVLTETGLVLTGTFEIVEESAAEPDRAQQAMMAMLSRQLFYGSFPLRGLLFGADRSTAKSTVSGPVAPLIPRYPNYYHWMVETVPKIRYLRSFESDQDPVTLLVPADAPSFIYETLDLLDWPKSRVERAERESYHVDELVIPSFPDRRPTDFGWLREEILGKVKDDLPETATNVYVSRSKAVERRVVNEDEVMDALSELGFERYYLEKRSLAENAKLFANANVVVGPHGAGLTDIIFAGDGTLVELFGKKVKRPYRLLADITGVEYEPMYCKPKSTDIIVNTDKLEQKISKLIE